MDSGKEKVKRYFEYNAKQRGAKADCHRSLITGSHLFPPVYPFTAIRIQMEKGYCDREFEEESMYDDRAKYALTASRNFEGIDAVTLQPSNP